MTLHHHRHHAPGRDLEWLLPVLCIASAVAEVAAAAFLFGGLL